MGLKRGIFTASNFIPDGRIHDRRRQGQGIVSIIIDVEAVLALSQAMEIIDSIRNGDVTDGIAGIRDKLTIEIDSCPIAGGGKLRRRCRQGQGFILIKGKRTDVGDARHRQAQRGTDGEGQLNSAEVARHRETDDVGRRIAFEMIIIAIALVVRIGNEDSMEEMVGSQGQGHRDMGTGIGFFRKAVVIGAIGYGGVIDNRD